MTSIGKLRRALAMIQNVRKQEQKLVGVSKTVTDQRKEVAAVFMQSAEVYLENAIEQLNKVPIQLGGVPSNVLTHKQLHGGGQ